MDNKEKSNSNINKKKKLVKILELLDSIKFPLILFIVALLFKLTDQRSITVWDEGWYGDIAGRMADGSQWVYTFYLNRWDNELHMFDKPPFIFWFGAIWIKLFGRTNIGIKMPMALAGATMAVCSYYFFSEDKKTRASGVIAGLLITSSTFINWWGRTAYIDIFVAAIAALTAVFAIKGISAVLKGDYKRGGILLIFTGVLNSFNLLTKAWQGLTIGPAIGIYLIFKYYEYIIDKENINTFSSDYMKTWRKNFYKYEEMYSNFSKPLIIGISVPIIVTLITLIFYFQTHERLYLSSTHIFGDSINWSFYLPLTCGLIVSLTTSMILLGFKHRENEELMLIYAIIAGIVSGIASWGTIKVFSDYTVRLIANLSFYYEKIFPIDLYGYSFTITNFTELLLGLISASIATLIILPIFLSIDILSRNRILFVKIYRDLTPFIPMVILGGWILYWANSILLGGKYYDHETFGTIFSGIFGIFLILIATLLIGVNSENIQNIIHIIIKNFSSKTFSKIVPEIIKTVKFPRKVPRKIIPIIIIFLAASIAITSFMPLLSWIQFADSAVEEGRYEIQKPGELYQDENAPDQLTYEWLFFEYYLGWRYEYGSPNPGLNLKGALGHVFNDCLVLITLFFFFIGLFAFYKDKDIALGLFFLVWLAAGAASFLPSQFQLSYYYLGLFIPYFCIVAKGIHWTYEVGTERFIVTDKTERVLIATPFLLYFTYSYVQYPLGSIGVIPFWNWVYFAILVSGYLLWTSAYAKTIPGILTAGACIYFFVRYMFLYKFYDHDFLILLVAISVLLLFAYWLRKDVRAAGLLIIIIACMASVGNVAWFTHINGVFDYRYEEMATYIRSHGGDYNNSVRVFRSYHIEYCLGFYMKHLIWEDDKPFSNTYNQTSNHDERLIDFIFTPPYSSLKYYVVLNGSFWADAKIDSTYSNTYRWFRDNMILLDQYVDIPWYNPMHLFGLGIFSTPRFVDLDADGDQDLVVGNLTGALKYFENVGTKENPEFKENSSIFSSFGIHRFASPTFGDLDGDGDYDMLLGDYSGDIFGFENNGTKYKPSWIERTTFAAGLPYVGICSKPQLIDLNNDSALDIVISSRSNDEFFVYTNFNFSGLPSWIGGEYFVGNGPTINKASVPAFADLNNDGTLEYYAGDQTGRINQWNHNSTNHWSLNNTLYYIDSETGYGYYIDLGFFSSPQFIDFDLDGDFDLVVGGKSGTIEFFENIGTKSNAVWQKNQDFFKSIEYIWNLS